MLAPKYYNYKHTHSVGLMAIAGPNYEYLYADVGSSGRMNDAGIWNKSLLRKKIESDEIYMPKIRPLPFGSTECFVGDDAFGLKT